MSFDFVLTENRPANQAFCENPSVYVVSVQTQAASDSQTYIGHHVSSSVKRRTKRLCATSCSFVSNVISTPRKALRQPASHPRWARTLLSVPTRNNTSWALTVTTSVLCESPTPILRSTSNSTCVPSGLSLFLSLLDGLPFWNSQPVSRPPPLVVGHAVRRMLHEPSHFTSVLPVSLYKGVFSTRAPRSDTCDTLSCSTSSGVGNRWSRRAVANLPSSRCSTSHSMCLTFPPPCHRLPPQSALRTQKKRPTPASMYFQPCLAQPD